MSDKVEALAPDLIGYVKLLAQKRGALVMGKQESDDKKYSITVCESLADYPNSTEQTLVLISKKTGGIYVKKSLLEKCEMSVFFWLIFGHLRRFYKSSEGTDAASWAYVVENYRGAKRTEFGVFYKEYNEVLTAYLDGTNESTKFGEYIYQRSMAMYNMSMSHILDMD